MDNRLRRKLPPELLSELINTLRFDIRWAMVRVSSAFDHLVFKKMFFWIIEQKMVTMTYEEIRTEFLKIMLKLPSGEQLLLLGSVREAVRDMMGQECPMPLESSNATSHTKVLQLMGLVQTEGASMLPEFGRRLSLLSKWIASDQPKKSLKRKGSDGPGTSGSMPKRATTGSKLVEMAPAVLERAAPVASKTDWTTDEKGNYVYSIDTLGYRKEELSVSMEGVKEMNVDVDGDEIVVKGKHKEAMNDGTVHRQFVRRVLIPEGFQKEGLKCKLVDDGSRMCITAPKMGTEPSAECGGIPIEVRDNAAKLGMDDKGNFTYSVDTSGYRPEELSVSMEGDEIVIQGEHKEAINDETVHRQFVRRVRIPEGFQKEGLKCELDDGCHMRVTVPKVGTEPSAERRSIPIEVKAKAIEDKK